MKNNLKILDEIEKNNIINPVTLSIARQLIFGLEEENQPGFININDKGNIVFEYKKDWNIHPEIEISRRDICYFTIEDGYFRVKFYSVGVNNEVFEESLFLINKQIEWIRKQKN